MRNHCIGCVLAIVAGVGPTATRADGGLPYQGTIFTYALDFCPAHSMQTDGQIIPITKNVSLFALLGNRYGGDGIRTFALPKLTPPETQKGPLISCIQTDGYFPPR